MEAQIKTFLDRIKIPYTNLRVLDELSKAKSKYPGVWSKEPDRVTWYLPEDSIVCCINRNATFGFLCGYLGLPKGHPYLIDTQPQVHGGVTLEARELGCYDPLPDELVPFGWLGFDCGHSYDVAPFQDIQFPSANYRDMLYVVKELMRAVVKGDYA